MKLLFLMAALIHASCYTHPIIGNSQQDLAERRINKSIQTGNAFLIYGNDKIVHACNVHLADKRLTALVYSYIQSKSDQTSPPCLAGNGQKAVDTVLLYTTLILPDTGQINFMTTDLSNIIVRSLNKEDFNLEKRTKNQEITGIVVISGLIVALAVGFTQLFSMRF